MGASSHALHRREQLRFPGAAVGEHSDDCLTGRLVDRLKRLADPGHLSLSYTPWGQE
ncbi:hypothetical protein [Streptomyces sp. NPDC002573]|uniref:hypothetical protein n=1 Tax=Streptomyces sp. NPDC002573 TaxID=3364651 RepID=UPI00367A968A